MSNAKDIRGKIKSIKNTQKITKAMEMVAASKMRKAQTHMEEGRPYADNIRRVAAHLAQASSAGEGKHSFLQESESVSKVGYIVVSTDRGLCGGLNINLFKKLFAHMKTQTDAGIEIQASVFGRKGVSFCGRMGVSIVSAVENYGDQPALHELLGGIEHMIEAFRQGRLQRIYLVANRFVNTMTQEPEVKQLLPVKLDIATDEMPAHGWDYEYEPSVDELLDTIAVRYVESLIKQAVAENIACEMAARMVAMKSASDNAGNLIGELQLAYNKARQAAITQELTEIVAGASAV